MGNIKLEKSKSQSMFYLFILLVSLVVWCLPAKAQFKSTVIATYYNSDAREVSLPDVFIKWAMLAPGAFNNDKWYPGPDPGRKYTEGSTTWNWNTLELPPEARPVPPDFDFAKHKEAFKQFYKNQSFEVRITWRGKTVTAPVNISWDSLGPWNMQDNYWESAEHPDPSRKRRLHASLPRGLPASEAAWRDNYMDGKDEAGRKTNGAGIDLSSKLANELGFSGKDDVEVEFLWVSDGDNPPVVNAFDVTPNSVTLGNSFTISYTVSDDIGLKQTELWRANDSNGSPVDWAEIERERTSLSGQTSYSGTFTDAPSSAGTYWYGMHVVDIAGQWSVEPNPPGPIKVIVYLPTPTLYNIVDGECGNYTVSWSSVSGATSYTLQEKKDSGSWQQVYSGSSTQKSFSDKPAGTYSYRVKACNTECSDWSGTKSVTVTGVPSTPTLYSISNPDCGDYTVSWSSVSNATNYILQEKKDSGSWQQVYSGSGTQKSFSDKEKGTYYYRVKATNTCGSSSWSSEKSATVTGVPDTPTLYSISNPDCGNYTVSWSSVSNATNYILQEKKDSGSWQQVYSGSGTQKSFSGKSVGMYCYRVKASSNCGDTSWSNEQCAPVTGKPNIPTLSDIYNPKKEDNYTVSWSSVSNATSYTLQEKKDSGSWQQVYSGGNTQYPISGKTAGVYCYRVRASNNCGDSLWSSEQCTPVGDELVAYAGTDKKICNPSNGGTHSVQIGGNPTASGGTSPYTYNWSPSTGLNNTSIPNPTASPTTTTPYTVTVTDANNDTATDSVIVFVNPELIAYAGEDVTINEGESTTIGGSPTASGGTPPYEYSWTPSTGLNNPNIANPVASPDVTTTYTVTVTDAIGCQDSDSVRVDGDSCFYVDIDCDGDVDVFDILLVAAAWGCELGDTCYDEKCDVNNDWAIDVFDILEVAKHWGEEAPFETVAPSLITVDKTSYPATVHLQASTPKITVGDSFNIELLASLPFAVQAFEFKIAYSQNAYAPNQPVVRFETLERDNLLKDKNGTFIHLGPKINRSKGTITYGGILLSKNVNGKSSGRLANLTFTPLLPGDCQIAISDIKLVNSDYLLLPIKITNPIKLHIKPKPPKQTALLQNYPNPFNPETWIPYQLTEASDVEIQIYDVSGKLIRTFSLGYKDAGYYQDKASAVHWDGKNEYGESVASNVYFYTIITENFRDTRKMMMLK